MINCKDCKHFNSFWADNYSYGDGWCGIKFPAWINSELGLGEYANRDVRKNDTCSFAEEAE
jgi:hypothetical protein